MILTEGDNILGVTAANDGDMFSPDDIIVTLDTTTPTINQPYPATTNDSTITLTGTAQVGSIVTLNQNNIQLEPVPVNDDGIWSLTVTLTEGFNTFTAVSTDESGNQSTPSIPVLIILDTTPPG